MDIRMLSTGDEPALEAFLRPWLESSMFLRANARAAGLVDRGEPLQGTYVAATDGGEIAGVAAHFWNGMLVLQAPDSRFIEPLARAAVARSGRELRGFVGPWSQCRDARSALGLNDRATVLDSREQLYALDLDRLRVPDDLASGRLTCRLPREDELDILADWRADYSIEALGLPGSPELTATSRVEIGRLQAERSQWILEDHHGRPVSYSAFNARLPDVVQIGGVWTPVELRGRGYGRAVVAGSLLDARSHGVTRAVLFTGEENLSARRAYESLGFRVVSDYALVIFG